MELPNCDECKKSVQLKEGVLSISFKEIQEVKNAREDWDKKRSRQSIPDMTDLMTYPESAQWRWRHCKCDLGSSYQIEAERLDNVEKVLHWTFHLMGKNWFELTDWRKAIMRLYPEVY